MTQIQTTELAPGYSISRLIKGGWQLAGDHGDVDQAGARDDMAAYYEAGITAFDCADIYTGVEEMIGAFRRDYQQRHGTASLQKLKVHTKFVPDLSLLATIDREQVEQIIDRSLARLHTDRLDLVQFHWWDYSAPRYLEVAGWLKDLQQAGKIDRLAATNFDTARTAQLVDAGIALVSMQVQYSLLDQRPARQLAQYAREHGIRLLCYGTVAGGFLSKRWLGVAEPVEIANRSLVKYKLIIDDFGGWDLFQALLQTLDKIALKHGVSIATIATRWVLDQDNVAAAIVGVRRGDHLAEHTRVFGVSLDDEDWRAIAAIHARSPGLEGDVYGLERDIHGRHGRIMKYELNKG
ncbi:Aldo-keto reductase YhdN [Paraburkholderia caffeinitolerans]|uniref:Aldo-keto reductase YhdN n=1 Tax=Paraburkholderia caffeinitolerans TaxID=1723730 RepID=A0A6J5GFJ3_9BURK|nr:aldo/keto reductase [Paraburkholderia caffeinitolerans]CAB3799950.1 Aldo-keto reductase YhdN [Paraburkholderia caffeinitolerans]